MRPGPPHPRSGSTKSGRTSAICESAYSSLAPVMATARTSGSEAGSSTMVRAAVALGYEYVAITDHSEHSSASRTVTPDQLARQREEIDRLRENYPTIEILQGLEVDILPDGRLRFHSARGERWIAAGEISLRAPDAPP